MLFLYTRHLRPNTHHLINSDSLKLMKPDSILVNTARGPVVDETALVEALKNKRIFAAALDVYEFEPNITSGLLCLDNVVLAPHSGTATVDARNDMSRFCIAKYHTFFWPDEQILHG